VRGLYYADWFEDYTAQIALAVAERSHEVSVIVRDTEIHFRETTAEGNAQRAKLKERIHRLFVLRGGYSSLKTYGFINRFIGDKNHGDYDYFHIQQSGDPRFVALVLRMPTVLTLHEPAMRQGLTSRGFSLRQLSNAAFLSLYRRLADRIIVHTQTAFKGLPLRERRKAVVIPKGIKALSDTALPPCDSKTILFFGRAAKYKGLDTLVAAMYKVWKVAPEAQLQILASPGDRECELEIPDSRARATWNGYSNAELEEALAKARVVCLPYTSVSGTAVGVQAYESGRPIVATDLEGLRELVPDEELLVAPGNATALASALLLALAREGQVREVDPNRTMKAIATAHTAVYESIAV